ncbi:MAG: SDR family NAD(P)-dependent oxidoreductase [Candidatus Dadabacteria bacterium]|nr:MAG: SDR family NAD(P)-dependent oxidoreductase [Candidatus Dadabacteria bacterium]
MSVIVIGATSPIAAATARTLVDGHDRFVLLARRPERLSGLRDALGDGADAIRLDLTDQATFAAAQEAARAAIDRDTVLLIAAGSIDALEAAPTDATIAGRLIDVNFRNIVTFATPLINRMREIGSGSIVVISSVAGERGRQSNFIYGAAKAGLTVWADGLRHYLYPHGVHVVTVIPGYVDTPMLRAAIGDKADRLPRWLVGTPEGAARRIVRALQNRTPRLWFPRIWRAVMMVIRLIPERIFVRTGL